MNWILLDSAPQLFQRITTETGWKTYKDLDPIDGAPAGYRGYIYTYDKGDRYGYTGSGKEYIAIKEG